MSAADFLDDAYPHGTVAGFRGGCRTNRLCATADGWLSCAAVHTRYASDWVFRKRVDAGATVAELREFDAVEAAVKAQAEKDANRRIRDAVKKERKAQTKRKRFTYGEQKRPTPVPYDDFEVHMIRDLNSQGWTDTEIAAHMGRPFGSLTAKRSALGLPRNKPRQNITHGTYAGYAAGCRDCLVIPSCHDAAKAYWRSQAEAKRRRDGVPKKEEVAA